VSKKAWELPGTAWHGFRTKAGREGAGGRKEEAGRRRARDRRQTFEDDMLGRRQGGGEVENG